MRSFKSLISGVAEETQHSGDPSTVDFNDSVNSRERIEAIKDWLSESNHAFSKDEGETYPVTSGETAEGHAMRLIREFKTAYQWQANLTPLFFRN